MKTLVVSAVNLRKGGTLSILRQCLEYLSDLSLGRPVPPRLRTWDSVFEDPQTSSGGASRMAEAPQAAPEATLALTNRSEGAACCTKDPQPDSGIAGTQPGGDFGPYEQEPLGCAPQKSGGIRVIALVHSRQLCDYPGIEYIEMPWCIRTWAHRLWAEYVTMHKISRQITQRDGHKPDLWLSLHDTTPRVEAQHQAVYCHTSFPFLKVKAHDWLMDPKVPLFAMLTKWAYRINVHKNDYLIVQQNWFADALSDLTRVPRNHFRVIPPISLPESSTGNQESLRQDSFAEHGVEACESKESFECSGEVPRRRLWPLRTGAGGALPANEKTPVFLFAATPDCHKNFETLCRASRLLHDQGADFKLILTIKGDENRYARWIHKHWGDIKEIDFHGFMSKDELFSTYAKARCFVCPSRVETWCLPISEYMQTNPGGKLLLADLPYAHETSGEQAVFFDPCNPEELKDKMKQML